MKKRFLRVATYATAGILLFSANGASINASGLGTISTFDISLGNVPIQELVTPVSVQIKKESNVIELTPEEIALCANVPVEVGVDENAPLNILIADVNDYVNVRTQPNLDGEIIGKLYDGCVGVVLEEVDGWCKISSGSVEGYVSAEYCITGEEAQSLYPDVVQKIATVTADGLNVRSEANTEATVLRVLQNGASVNVLEVQDEWVKVVCGTKEGFVSKEYVTVTYSYEKAETLEEEKARLAAEAEAKKKKQQEEAAAAAAEKAAQQALQQSTTTSTPTTTTPSTTFSSDASSYDKGLAVAEFALQYVGNPYVWGGTSLTNGADCSGFVLAVYKNFGVSLPHSANADQKEGYAVDGIENAQPGDLICYSGHVGIYIGNGQIVHASTSRTGIKISDANYKTIAAVRRIF